jgi:hypothetical protein
MSDSSAIDEKNQELNSSTTPTSYLSNVVTFALNILIVFIIIVLYFGSSGLILYSCKLGQSNILPTDTHCYPYQDTKPNIQPIPINIFNTLLSDPPMSNKIKFPYDEYNSENKLLDMFRKYKDEPRSNFLANYFISILESITQFNYSSFNFILNLLNQVPEILILLFGPIIVFILGWIVFLLDHLYLIYLWFAGMGWFFKTNTNDSGTGKPDWESVTLLNWFGYWCAIWLVILFVILFFFSLPLLSVVTFLSMTWCMFSCITYKAELNGKSITSIAVIQDVYKYYKLLIMSILSFFVVVSAFANLGAIPGIFSILTLCLIYWGIISIDIFKPISKDGLSPLVSYKLAKKTCSNDAKPKEKHGLLYNFIFGQSGGNNIKNDLKKLGKQISRK